MPEVFKRLTARDVGTSRVRIGGYTVAAATKVIVLGMTVANKLAAQVAADVEHHDGANYTFIAKGVALPAGSSLAPCGEMNKLILEPGDGLFVKSDTAASLDVVVSILEIS
jgi:hypothetical protein